MEQENTNLIDMSYLTIVRVDGYTPTYKAGQWRKELCPISCLMLTSDTREGFLQATQTNKFNISCVYPVVVGDKVVPSINLAKVVNVSKAADKEKKQFYKTIGEHNLQIVISDIEEHLPQGMCRVRRPRFFYKDQTKVKFLFDDKYLSLSQLQKQACLSKGCHFQYKLFEDEGLHTYANFKTIGDFLNVCEELTKSPFSTLFKGMHVRQHPQNGMFYTEVVIGKAIPKTKKKQ